ncbi:MAG: hypothetical protein GXP29_04665, partial [Planctomycetes bacterium]|nr:hypothetical protein [Planctomycetota bacterium]
MSKPTNETKPQQTEEPRRVRFVILHHQPNHREHSDSASSDPPKHFDEHWDLMIEINETLATWQLQQNPLTNKSTPIAAKQIANHRKAYLDYEGPISQGRGKVQRIEQGRCEIIKTKPTRWLLNLEGNQLNGQYKLRHVQDENWTWEPI